MQRKRNEIEIRKRNRFFRFMKHALHQTNVITHSIKYSFGNKIHDSNNFSNVANKIHDSISRMSNTANTSVLHSTTSTHLPADWMSTFLIRSNETTYSKNQTGWRFFFMDKKWMKMAREFWIEKIDHGYLLFVLIEISIKTFRRCWFENV